MPELPEVEVTRQSFSERIADARILSARLGKPLRWPLGIEPQQLIDCVVRGVRRRGKYLLMDLDDGMLLVHLGMSGSLAFSAALPPQGIHDHFELVTDRGTLRLNDPRRFGAVVWVQAESSSQALRLLGRLGMEPLDQSFDFERFYSGLKGRRAAIKQVLLAGDLVVGVGNIYASEALFVAGILPTRPACHVGRLHAEKLHTAIRAVLARAVAQGGSTLRDFSSATGAEGHFQREAMVYGRSGLPCRICGEIIQTIRQGQRSTYYCLVCQKN
jgi:formamidopyrimidine-DNA glycosylase